MWIVILCVAVLVFALAIWVQACRIATRAVNPDEHQFVASAVLLAREGKLPYVDYPYMHLPHQTFALAGFYKLGAEHLLLTARVMNGVLGVLGLAMVCGLIVAAGQRRPAAWAIGLLAVLVLLFNPLFAYTSGLSWNHDGSVFLLLCCIASLWRGFALRSTMWIGVAGLSLGLATGVRSTIAPVVVPLLAALVWQVVVARRLPMKAIVVFILAGITSQLPTLILAGLAPERFWWGNVGYALANTRLREDTAFERAMSLRDKLTYLRDIVFSWGDHRRGNLVLLAWAIGLSLVAGAMIWRRQKREPIDWTRPPLVLLASLLPFALLGSLLPTPSWIQYYYILIPLMTVVAGCFVARAIAESPRRSVFAAIAIIALAGVAIESLRKLNPDERCLTWPATVVPVEVHRQGVQLATLTSGRVLTIDPIYALEGGREIFAELASGAYAYRVGRVIPPDERAKLLIVGPDDIAARVAAEHEAPSLLIREPRVNASGRLSNEDDERIRNFGLDRGWNAVPIDGRRTLFIPQ